MLLLWVKLAHIQFEDNRCAKCLSIAYDFFVKFSMFYMPALMISWAIYFSQIKPEDMMTMYPIAVKLAQIISLITGATLLVHSIGFFFYGSRIYRFSKAADGYYVSRNSQAGRPSTGSTVAQSTRQGVRVIVRYLSWVVAIGWISLGVYFIVPFAMPQNTTLMFYSTAFWLELNYYGIVLASNFLITGGFGTVGEISRSQLSVPKLESVPSQPKQTGSADWTDDEKG